MTETQTPQTQIYALRLKHLRQYLNLSQREFFERTGINQPNLSALETGTRIMGNRYQQIIVKALNVNPKWWKTGEGEVLRKATKEMEVYGWEDFSGVAVDYFSAHDFEDCEKVVLYNGPTYGNIKDGCYLWLEIVSPSDLEENDRVVIVQKNDPELGRFVSYSYTDSQLFFEKQDSTNVVLHQRKIRFIYRIVWVLFKG